MEEKDENKIEKIKMAIYMKLDVSFDATLGDEEYEFIDMVNKGRITFDGIGIDKVIAIDEDGDEYELDDEDFNYELTNDELQEIVQKYLK